MKILAVLLRRFLKRREWDTSARGQTHTAKSRYFCIKDTTMNPIRIGFGYDTHRLVEGRKLILGGKEIPHEKGLLGHSDADVLLHAICDAMLGALNLRDIGYHFPDTDPRYAGADSKIFLQDAYRLICRTRIQSRKYGLHHYCGKA